MLNFSGTVSEFKQLKELVETNVPEGSTISQEQLDELAATLKDSKVNYFFSPLFKGDVAKVITDLLPKLLFITRGSGAVFNQFHLIHLKDGDEFIGSVDYLAATLQADPTKLAEVATLFDTIKNQLIKDGSDHDTFQVGFSYGGVDSTLVNSLIGSLNKDFDLFDARGFIELVELTNPTTRTKLDELHNYYKTR
ncbi:hypothetical protein [Vibrio harveyi]|uniref:hypothetical protein n=1 Tax=Vibrio harveyi TaxID=669 RepID=UPI003908F7D5